MKKFEISLVLAAIFLTSLASADVPAPVPRIESPESIALRAISKEQALGTQQLVTYSRRPGIGNLAMSKKLSGLLPDMGLKAAEIAAGQEGDESGTHLFTGTSWLIHTSGDGRHGRAWRATAGLPSVDASARMSYDNVVSLAEKVLYGKVNAIIGIPSTEKLRVLYVSYLGKIATNVSGFIFDSQVLVSYAAFGRSINGVPVVGFGSFVKIGLDVSGQLVGVDFDWSQYDPTAAVQTTVAIDSISNRFGKLSAANVGANIKYVECGYYDPGVQGQIILGILQPVCVYSMKNGPTAMTIAVPAGLSYVADEAWQETVALSAK